MEFKQPKGIYQQIADQVRGRIVSGEWKAGERIPSVREMAAQLGVNPNTITRSYQSLLDGNIIENRRGIGYFVANEAQEIIVQDMKTEFIEEELPRVFDVMRQLGVDIQELLKLYEDYSKEKSS
ncbi:MAG: GntR family transcriptional regulator [Spirochaetales bacterium]|nr:GntR family transcriptional regulator [Spirochaetales bacterium]